MKNHRITKIGLIIPDFNQIKDYQISIVNSLKKNKKFKIKLIKVDFERKDKINNFLFFFEKKFKKNKNKLSSYEINYLNQAAHYTLKELSVYKKNDIDLFINILGLKISNLIKINSPIWEIEYGRKKDSKYPVCFEDLLQDKPYSLIKIIQIYKGDYKEIISGKFNIKKYALLHQEFIFEKTHVLLIKALKLFNNKKLNYKKISQIKQIKEITFFDILKYFFKNYFFKYYFKDRDWKIFYQFNKKNSKLKLDEKNYIRNQTNHYFADPFIYKFKKNFFIFFENFNKKNNKGTISFIDISNKNKITELIKKKYHLSYPFIFRFKKQIYLSLETARKKELQIWKCLEFPNKWKIYKNIFKKQSVVDPTFFLDKEKKLWLFINKSIDKYKDHNSELYIYEVKNNFTKFVPHKLNPVIIDCTLARNAGNLFYRKSKLYKPCQVNIKGKYGYGLQIIEIKKLTLNEFQYKKNNNMFKNIHHLSCADGLIAWDKSN